MAFFWSKDMAMGLPEQKYTEIRMEEDGLYITQDDDEGIERAVFINLFQIDSFMEFLGFELKESDKYFGEFK